uniref:RAVE complex protein Rav1 C-terminal domain-containing protein n=1 Tax=Castor canadensis TaxID=51338 RepID=A0A8C0XIX4_CASCN
ECVQIIPGAKHGNIQVSCVECSNQQGRVRDLIDLLNVIFNMFNNLRIFSSFFAVLLYSFLIYKDDCLLKVWYPMTGWKSSIIPQDHHEVKRRQTSTQFSFVYLAHPRAVTGFSWRKSSKYMPRGSVCNVLLTSCHDGVCRLWAETLLPEDCLLGEQICETTTSSVASNLSHAGRHKDRIQHALEVLHCLRWRSSVLVTHTELMPDQMATHEVQRHISHHANALCHFHIAASINPATDIPNALVGTAFNIDDGNGGFVVHWLNNKEFHFTSSAEIFMHQLRKISEKHLDHESDDVDREDEERSQEERERGLYMKLDHEHEDGEREGSPRTISQPSLPVPLPTVLLDRKIEMLLTEWNKNPDMLFTIHPVDGTFLVWHVKYLDEYNPGIFRQVQVSFSSRIPVAFPSGDASSLSKNIMMYACINATKDSHHTPLHQELTPVDSPPVSQPHSQSHSTNVNILAPTVMMVSKHIDGSLNQWAVTFADKSAFTTVLTVSHKFRYCGHRFHLNDLACHSVLPLLLTSSHHNALLTPESNQWDSDSKLSKLIDPVKHMKGLSKQPLRNAATRTFHDPNAIYSELILWRVDPIGPLSYTGGVSELARINSLHTSAFSNVAWLPTLIPSYCLGTYCNSASACFVASDGKNLRLYQAVVDARKLLDELSDPEASKLIGEVFNIVSQQSTARPGCIIELDAITDQVKTSSEIVSSESLLSVPVQKNVDSSPETSPSVSPMPHSSSIANLQTASKLILSSRLVYSQPLDLPESVEVIRATPSAGHLSSSSIYPVCLAPYLVVTTCSDNKVRFWKCCVETSPQCNTSDKKETYHWKKWPLMNDEGEDNSSTVSIVGRPVAVSCSYTGRLAVAYKQPIHHNGFVSKEFSMHVCIFECESTGGSEWVLEQTIHLDDLVKVGSVLDSRVSVDSNLFVYSKSDALLSKDRYLIPNIKHLVHLDWVSKEDGSHILTVGVGANIFMYGRLSGIVTEQTNSKDGVAVITLPLGGSIKQGIRSRWVLLRSIDLVSSVDGTPSLPVSLSWVRDGILVVGMDCEMHVYAQWKHAVKFGDTEADSPSAEETAIQDHSAFKSNTLARKSIVEGTAIVDDVFYSPTVAQDGGLFEAAHVLSPTLPQYHPTQLLELMDLGKVRRAKAILSHLVKCIAGEVAIVRDADAGEGTKRHLSRTISVSGSTAKDTVTIGKDGTRDYTEIDSIPPLPLYALLAADQDTSYRISEESTRMPQSYEDRAESQPEDQYSELFQIQDITTDDIDLEPEKRESKSKVINLSQYGPAYFGQEHARVLSSHLMHSSLPGLTRLEQMFLVALADTVATTSTELDENRDKNYSGRDTLDECGLRYLLAMRLHTCLLTSLPPLYRVQLLHQGVSTCHFAWAFHSEAEEELINMIPAIQRGDPQWSELRAMGIGWWVRNINTLRRCIEKVAKASFQRNNDALDAALFYLSMKKKAVVWGLFRSQHDEKMTTFFSHNFNEDRWRKAALKNAFSLLGKQRFEQSAAFFLLAGSLKDAIEVCLEKMEDIQLAMVIARLYESEIETSSTYMSILNQKILGCQKEGSGFNCRRLHPDPFLRSLAYWVMKDYTQALDTLLEQTPKEDDEHQVIIKSCNPVVFSFYNYLRTHPLLIRRNLASPEGTLATLGLKTEKNFADKINLIERKLFFTTANAHFKVGCPVLALEVLSKIPKVTKMSSLTEKKDQSNFISKKMGDGPSESKTLSDGSGSSGNDWSAVTSSQFDWSQPVLTVNEEPLNLDWGEEHDSALEEEEDAIGLVMKSTDTRGNDGQDQKASDPNMLLTPQEEDPPEGDTEVDVIAEQLKFRACLKILMTELRTLATGYEVDGGKLRFQLYNWLEKEIAALHEICNHEAVIKEYSSKTYSKLESDLLDQEEIVDKPDIGSYERHQIERRRLQAKREHAERRKLWLQKNQDLLRVFLSYCSLHGAQGGGLASVRMELKFLLQESQQETTVKQLQSPLPLPTTLPLLSASIASTKTVIANPVLYLNNHIHDILYTIVQMKTPPHPSVEDVKVHTLHSLAASLSASIYQALCDSHSYSQTEGNQFTGMAYQGLLLSDRRRLRTESIEEHATPNSSPAQWPGEDFSVCFCFFKSFVKKLRYGTMRQFSRKQCFIVLAQTQWTHVQRLSPENKGVSPYVPLQAGYRGNKI